MKKGKERKEFDPLGIAEKYHLEQFSDSIDSVRVDLDVGTSLAIQFTTRVTVKKHNNSAFGTEVTGGKRIEEITY